MKRILVLVALALAACQPMQTRQLVAAAPLSQLEVPASIPEFGITSMMVGSANGRLWVQPTKKRLRELTASSDTYRLEEVLPMLEPAYRAAAQEYLAAKHINCTVVDPKPIARAYGIDFGYRCS